MGKAKSKAGEGEAGEQPTVHQGQCTKKRKKEKKKKSHQPPATSHQPPAKAHASAMHCHTTSNGGKGKACTKSARGHVAKACQTAQKEEMEGGRHTARGCGSRDELVGDAGVS